MRALAVLGNVNVDLIMGPTPPWPRPGTEVVVERDELRAGGGVAYAGLAWAALGAPHVVAAGVGDDAFGRWLRGCVPGSGAWAVAPCATTISVGLTHPDGERTFFTTRGHLPELSWEDARAQLDRLEGGLLLLCGGFLTERLTADYPALMAWAAAGGVDVALDPGWPPGGWTDAAHALARGWLGGTRHLLVNEVEALALSGAPTVAAALPTLAALMPPGASVVVKAGADGAHGWQGGAHHAPAPAVTVVDTIGAGDVFNAGYLLALAEGASFPAALAEGVALASRAVSTHPRLYERAPRLRGVA